MQRRDLSRRVDRQVPDVAVALARAVDTGSTVLAALDEVAATTPLPAGEDLRRVVVAVERGVPLHRVLDGWVAARGSDGVALLAAALRHGHSEGGAVAESLDAVALAVADRHDAEDDARSLGAQARSSAVALTLLPPVGAAAFVLLDPQVATTLVATSAGRLCLAAGALLDAAGWLAMKAVTARVLR